MKLVAPCRMDVNRKEEGGQGRCVAMLIASILTMTQLFFSFFFRLVELTFIVLVVCCSTRLVWPRAFK